MATVICDETETLPDLTLLDQRRSGAVCVVALLLRCVVAVLRHCVRRRAPLLVAVVTVRELGGALRLAELQLDLPVLLLHLSDPGLQDGSLQNLCGGRVGQAGRQEEGAAILGGTTRQPALA